MSEPGQGHRSPAVARAAGLLGHAGRLLRPGPREPEQDRWLVVTIDRDIDQVSPGGVLPTLLVELGDAVEVDLRPAPGEWGTELAARPTGRAIPVAFRERPEFNSADLRKGLRQVLRQVKQVVEVGEVLQSQPRPEGRRPPTLGGKLVDKAERVADQGGVL